MNSKNTPSPKAKPILVVWLQEGYDPEPTLVMAETEEQAWDTVVKQKKTMTTRLSSGSEATNGKSKKTSRPLRLNHLYILDKS